MVNLPRGTSSTAGSSSAGLALAPGTSTVTPVGNAMDFSELVTKREIALRAADLGDGDLGVLIEVLEKTRVLESLDLSANRLTLEDGSFASALSRNATLKELSLDSNRIVSEGAWWLGRALASCATLERLSLDGNKLGDEAAGHLSDLLAASDALAHLSLDSNRIGERGAARLAAALKENRGLGTLSVRGNRIGKRGVNDLAAALEANKTLSALHVGSEDDPAQQRICRLLFRKDDLLEELAKKDAEIAERDAQIAKRDEAMAKMERIMEAEVDRLAEEVARRDRTIAAMRRDLESNEIRSKLAEKGEGREACSAAAHHEEEGIERDERIKDAEVERLAGEVARRDRTIANMAADTKKDGGRREKDLREELATLRAYTSMYIATFDGRRERELEDKLATIRTHTSMYVNSFEDPDESALARKEDQLELLRTHATMYVNSFGDEKAKKLEDELETMRTHTNMYVNSFEKSDESALKRKEDELETLRTHTTMYVNSFGDEKAKKLEDELETLRTHTTMYVNSFENPDESALKRREDELETLRTHMNMYVNSFEKKDAELRHAGPRGKGRSTALYEDVLAALSDVAGVIDTEDELRTLTLYTSMMLGLSDGEKQKAEVERKNEDLASMALHMSIMMGLSDRRAAPAAEDRPGGPAANVPAEDNRKAHFTQRMSDIAEDQEKSWEGGGGMPSELLAEDGEGASPWDAFDGDGSTSLLMDRMEQLGNERNLSEMWEDDNVGGVVGRREGPRPQHRDTNALFDRMEALNCELAAEMDNLNDGDDDENRKSRSAVSCGTGAPLTKAGSKQPRDKRDTTALLRGMEDLGDVLRARRMTTFRPSEEC